MGKVAHSNLFLSAVFLIVYEKNLPINQGFKIKELSAKIVKTVYN